MTRRQWAITAVAFCLFLALFVGVNLFAAAHASDRPIIKKDDYSQTENKVKVTGNQAWMVARYAVSEWMMPLMEGGNTQYQIGECTKKGKQRLCPTKVSTNITTCTFRQQIWATVNAYYIVWQDLICGPS